MLISFGGIYLFVAQIQQGLVALKTTRALSQCVPRFKGLSCTSLCCPQVNLCDLPCTVWTMFPSIPERSLTWLSASLMARSNESSTSSRGWKTHQMCCHYCFPVAIMVNCKSISHIGSTTGIYHADRTGLFESPANKTLDCQSCNLL